MFLFFGNLILSVVPDGTARDEIEFSVKRDATTSLKGSLDFPITAPVSTAAPYASVSSRCMGCHGPLRPDSLISGGLDNFYTPAAPSTQVPLSDVQSQAASCNAATRPERCAMLSALFNNGPVQSAAFP
jgi:hypothetical protein